MKNIYQLIHELRAAEWNYYDGIDSEAKINIPFSGDMSCTAFIKSFFKRGGKINVFESSGINFSELNRPNHICSVFFLGILLYYKTSFHKKYSRPKNDPGYRNFPFIWFLIALFHDNAYQMEEDTSLKDIKSLADVKSHFAIDHFLLDQQFSRCQYLATARENYFIYRKEKMKAIDHGILGGILLYDRLVKIRRDKKANNENNLFWGKKLENDYLLAANAISLHNIWLPEKKDIPVYKEYKLERLIKARKAKFKDFPLYYILGIVDTIEPLKEYMNEYDDKYILENITMEFRKNSLIVSMQRDAEIDFQKMIKKARGLESWLDISVKVEHNSFELLFS